MPCVPNRYTPVDGELKRLGHTLCSGAGAGADMLWQIQPSMRDETVGSVPIAVSDSIVEEGADAGFRTPDLVFANLRMHVLLSVVYCTVSAYVCTATGLVLSPRDASSVPCRAVCNGNTTSNRSPRPFNGRDVEMARERRAVVTVA